MITVKHPTMPLEYEITSSTTYSWELYWDGELVDDFGPYDLEGACGLAADKAMQDFIDRLEDESPKEEGTL